MENSEVVRLKTNLGDIVVELLEDKAPKHAESFKKLAASGFYDGTRFHRVIPGFMIQGGDPNSKSDDRMSHGTGGPGYKIPAEFNDVLHERGILSAARSQDPNSAGSQFFLMVARAPHLDRQYSAFGRVIEGMDVVDKIVALPRDRRDNPLEENPAIIEKATVETR
ncbi:peptidylprolyl isomerase [bacterium]|nr:MAG: peptidylprolyl isomerase [bacterium]